MKKILQNVILTVFVTITFNVTAQVNQDSTQKEFRNTVMINISNPMIISNRFLTVGYERTLAHNQSFTVNVGTFSLPKFGEDAIDSLQLDINTSEVGLHFSFDYRFYLKKENKYPAPRGAYWGPYYTFNYLNRDNVWNINTADFVGNVDVNYNISIHSLGVQFGYQFIIKNRFTLDLILSGPGIGYYTFNTTIGTDLEPSIENKLFQEINDALAARIPGYSAVISPGSYEKQGNFNTFGGAYRFVIHAGYRF